MEAIDYPSGAIFIGGLLLRNLWESVWVRRDDPDKALRNGLGVNGGLLPECDGFSEPRVRERFQFAKLSEFLQPSLGTDCALPG